MDELFNQLLDISKLDAGVLTPTISDFPIAQLLKRTESIFAATARKGCRCASCRTALGCSDAILLERICKFGVQCSRLYGKRWDRGWLSPARQAVAHRDSGPGIPKDQHQNIFAEFHQVGGPQHERRSGLGLGLAIVDRLCRLLDHRIELTSALGNGSRFFVVPLVVGPVLTAEPKASVHAALGSISGNLVVVIDDDALVLDSTGRLLRGWGCDVVTAVSAHAALAELAERGRTPHLIVSDYRLSDGQNGIEAIEKLRQAFNLSIPAFLISGDMAPKRLQERELPSVAQAGAAENTASHAGPVLEEERPRRRCSVVADILSIFRPASNPTHARRPPWLPRCGFSPLAPSISRQRGSSPSARPTQGRYRSPCYFSLHHQREHFNLPFCQPAIGGRQAQPVGSKNLFFW